CKCWTSWTNSAFTATWLHIIALSFASVWESAMKQFDGWSKVSLMPVQIIPILEFILFSARSAAIRVLRRSPRRLFPHGNFAVLRNEDFFRRCREVRAEGRLVSKGYQIRFAGANLYYKNSLGNN